MIVDVFPEAVVWLPEEREFVARLAEGQGGHAKYRFGCEDLEPIEDVLEDLAAYLPDGRTPEIVTLNSRSSGWHVDAASHERSVIAWVVFGSFEGGDLEWQTSNDEAWLEGVYTPRNGDVALINGRACLHRITEIVDPSPNAKRLSIVLA